MKIIIHSNHEVTLIERKTSQELESENSSESEVLPEWDNDNDFFEYLDHLIGYQSQEESEIEADKRERREAGQALIRVLTESDKKEGFCQ